MTDSYGRSIDYLRISLTDRCNLRCLYCMPETGITKLAHHELLSLEEVYTIAKTMVELGVTKIRLTGGEPTVRLGLVSLVEKLAKLPIKDLAMTTNGYNLLTFARPLKEAGLQRLNISLDSLNPETYHTITRGGDLSQTLRGISHARALGFPIKLNVVLGSWNESEISDFVALTKHQAIEVRFIELMPIGHARHLGAGISNEKVLARVPELKPIGQSGVATRYQLPGALGTVGLISPVSCRFCDHCNRLRLTSEGLLKPCLHSAKTCDLKPHLKTDLAQAILACVAQKPERSRFDEGIFEEREMVKIGG